MKNRQKHICNRMGAGFLFCLPLDRALTASTLPQPLKLWPWGLAKVAECPTSQNSGIMYDPFK